MGKKKKKKPGRSGNEGHTVKLGYSHLDHHPGGETKQRCENLWTRTHSSTVRTSPVAQVVKNPPAVQESLVQFLGQEDPLEKG